MNYPIRFFTVLTIALSTSSIIFAATSSRTNNSELNYSSSAAQAQMIELYTSEGCSSCPPAEERLNRYEQDPQLWKSIIPMAFHVDYWDYIGWRDRFASPLHGKRQSRYAKLNRQRTVYTPAFVVNGVNWQPGLIFNRSPQSKKNDVGILELQVKNKSIRARFNPVEKTTQPLVLNIAVLGMDLSSDIERGENSGRKASHHFVVLATRQLPSGTLNWQTELPRLQAERAPRYALVAWVSREGQPAPLQAVGGIIPNQVVE